MSRIFKTGFKCQFYLHKMIHDILLPTFSRNCIDVPLFIADIVIWNLPIFILHSLTPTLALSYFLTYAFKYINVPLSMVIAVSFKFLCHIFIVIQFKIFSNLLCDFLTFELFEVHCLISKYFNIFQLSFINNF